MRSLLGDIKRGRNKMKDNDICLHSGNVCNKKKKKNKKIEKLKSKNLMKLLEKIIKIYSINKYQVLKKWLFNLRIC